MIEVQTGPAITPERELAHVMSILDSSPNAVVGMDGEGRITTWSAQAERTFGHPRADVLGRTVAETMVPQRLRESHEQGFRRYLASQQGRILGSTVTVDAIHRDGHEFPVELAISAPVTGVDGRLEFIAFVRDISDRIRNQRMRTMQFQVTRALTTSTHLDDAARTILRAIATALRWPVGVLWLVDGSGTRLRQAHAWHGGGSALDRVVDRGAELTFPPGEGFPGEVWAAEHPISSGNLATDAWLSRAAVLSAAGLHAAAGFPITNRGAVVGVVELMGRDAVALDEVTLSVVMDLGQQIGQFVERVDVSDMLARTNLRLLAKAADLERSNTDLEEFARVASHDLQEPLRMVASYVQLLGRRYRGSLDEEADEYIAFATDGARRMQALIDDLLTYSRSGRDAGTVTAVDAGECVDSATANLASAIAESNAEVIRRDLPVVSANATALSQVFQNLIGNALKFRGQAPPRVEVWARREQDHWIFSVRDNGIGIDPGQAARVFQVFTRLHSQDKYPGTGIGLALCKKVIERWGGTIRAESEPGSGSTFSFTLPVTAGRPADSPAAAA